MVEILMVNILIRTDFIDKYVRNVYPLERRLKPPRLKPIVILLAGATEI